MFTPPFTITSKIITLVADISAQVEPYAIRLEMEDALHLRKTNRIKTIHSSLAIEGNKLTESQVSDIIEPLDSVRSVFIVRGSQNGGGALLGETVDSFSDWTRQGDSVATLERAIIGSPSAEVSSGEFYLDGVLTNCNKALPTGGYELIDVHQVWPTRYDT